MKATDLSDAEHDRGPQPNKASVRAVWKKKKRKAKNVNEVGGRYHMIIALFSLGLLGFIFALFLRRSPSRVNKKYADIIASFSCGVVAITVILLRIS
jgi:hypothetical protein